MASNSKKTGGAAAAKSTGGTATLTIPEGFSTEKSKFYADAVTRRFDTLPPKGGVVRILLATVKDASVEQVRTLLGNPRYALKLKAPGVYEATVMPRDMELVVAPNVGADKTFRWVDLANRFFGMPVEDPNAMVTVAVSYEGNMADAKKKMKSLGMTVNEPTAPPDANQEEGEWVNPDEDLVMGTMSASKLYDLALMPKAVSIEIRGVETPQTKS